MTIVCVDKNNASPLTSHCIREIITQYNREVYDVFENKYYNYEYCNLKKKEIGGKSIKWIHFHFRSPPNKVKEKS